jgi:hypothetical protein
MNRVIVILLVSVLGAGLVACAAHGDLWLGADPAASVSHGFGCSVPSMIVGLLATLSLLPLTGRLVAQPGPERLLRLPVSFFQPPERSA